MRKALLALLVAIAVIHAIPYLATHQPFSTDVWPLIRISEKLVENPSLRIWMDRAFDGYNNRWPGVILEATALRYVLGMDLGTLYGAFMTLALCLSVAILVYAACKGSGSPLLSTTMLLAIPSFVVFTSSALKEVYSYPIALSALLLALRSTSSLRYVAVVPLLALAQVVSHHLSTAMFLLIASSALAIMAIDGVYGLEIPRALARNLATYLAVGGPIALAYYELYGGRGLAIHPSVADAVTAAMYFLLVYAIYALFTSPRSRGNGLGKRLALTLAGALLLLAFAKLQLVPGIRVELRSVLPYAIAAILPLSMARSRGGVAYLGYGAGLSVAALMGFIAFSKPILSGALHRVANYLAFSYALSSYDARSRGSRALNACVATACVVIALYVMYSIAAGIDSTCFYWLYTEEDTALGSFLAKHVGEGVRVVGGAKVSYLERMRVEVDTRLAIEVALRGPGALPRNSLLVLSSTSFSKGIAASLNLYRPRFAEESLSASLSLVLSSSSYGWYWC